MTDIVATGTPWVVVTDDWTKHHFLADSADDAKAQFLADRPNETIAHVRLAVIDDAPWTTDRCSPTDDPAYWRMDKPCDYDLGEKRSCHHPVHAFREPKPLRHLIDTWTATTAAKYGWWTDRLEH